MVSMLKSWTNIYSFNKEEQSEETKTPVVTEDSLREFRTALHAIPGLRVSDDDGYLLRFLRAKSFKIPEAVKLYSGTDGWKEKNAPILNIPFTSCLPVYEKKLMTVLREKDPEGRTMFYIKPLNWDLPKITLEIAIKSLYNLIEETQLIEENQINGIVLIVDITGLAMTKTVEALAQFSIKNIKLLVGFAQGGSPCKVKGIYAVSTPLIAVTTYTGVKYLLKKKMRNRINIYYEGVSAIHKYIPKDCLPQYLGGNIPDDLSEDTELMKSLFLKNNVIYTP